MNDNKKKCYVFSRATLDSAVAEWAESKIKIEPKKAEILQIVSAALPWFLEHIQLNASIYMFTEDDLNTEIDVWKQLQLSSYPDQKKRIEETCDLIIEFFQSEVIKGYKMIVNA